MTGRLRAGAPSPRRPLRVGLPSRVSLLRRAVSYVAGRRDAFRRLPCSSDGRPDGELHATDTTTMWLRRNESSYREDSEREFLKAEACVADPIRRLTTIDGRMTRLEEQRERLLPELAELLARPLLRDEDIARGPGELRADAATIRNRREGKRRSEAAVLQGTIERLRSELDALAAEGAELSGTVQLEFDAAVSRSERVRHFRSRCAAIYLRGLTRNHPDGPAVSAMLADSADLTPTAWSVEPCPYLPDRFSNIRVRTTRIAEPTPQH